jgi:CRP-like cAMP-binding protein
MSLNHNRLLLCYKILHNVFPEDMHIARPLIQMLLQRDQVDQAQNLALSTARRMLAIGNAGHAIGFLTICMQLNHPEKEEINSLGRMAHIASSTNPIQVDNELSQSFALIEQLSDQEGLDFLKQGHIAHAKQGEDIVTQGETSKTLYLILEGEVDVHIIAQGDHEKNLSILHPGYFFGEFACVYKLPRSATVTARGKVLLLEFSDHSIAKLMQHFPLAGDYLMRTVQSRMVHAMTYSSPAFAELPEEDRLWAAEESFIDEYQEGEKITVSSQSEKFCYILLSGKAELGLLTEGNQEELVPGSIFGDINPHIQLPSSAEIRASEHTLVCRMPENIFRSFMNVYASFEQHIKQIANNRSKAFQN